MHDEAARLRIDDPRPPLAARLASPLIWFGRQATAGGIVLLVCALAAMVWANSAWAHSYHALVHLPVAVGVGDFSFQRPLEWWVNDGLMAVFFFVVGLEIKRELLIGELRSVRAATLPIVAAVGGMVVPGLVYFLFNMGQPTVRGWGIPTATDIAFSLGVLAMLGSRVPHGLRVFLATLAIADDIGALLVIAMFYTEQLQLHYLAGAGGCLAVMVGLNVAGVRRWWLYLPVGVVMWWLVYQSGVHATIAGVMAAFTIPSRSRIDNASFLKFIRNSAVVIERDRGESVTTSAVQQQAVQGIEDACGRVQTPMQTLEHALAPWVTFLILPVFALANAGVALGRGGLGAAAAAPETAGVVAGLAIGKPLGITLCSYLAVRLGLGSMPTGVNWRMLHGCAWIAGIGFTMSLFIANLAFPADSHGAALSHAKVGVLSGSLVAGVVGFVILFLALRRTGGAPR